MRAQKTARHTPADADNLATADGLNFEAVVDPQARPGNVLPALARLLIDLAEKRRQQAGERMPGGKGRKVRRKQGT